MAITVTQANLYDEAIAQGLSSSQAFSIAGITDQADQVLILELGVGAAIDEAPPLRGPQPLDDFAAEQQAAQQAAAAEAQAFERGSIPPAVPADDPQAYPNGTPLDDDGNLNPGWDLNETTGEYIYVGDDFVAVTTSQSAAFTTAQLKQAQQQAAIQRQNLNDKDWRVRLRLAPQAKYLYNDPSTDLLAPLRVTDGVIFPYLPEISITYLANYNREALTHNNYLQYFYTGSSIDAIQVNATFTAQDTNEARYLFAAIHFFRSCTKMFYGQDVEAGAPPPLVYLSGLGNFQFNEHPCVIQQFNYQLPRDVDYIRFGQPNNRGVNLNPTRPKQTVINPGILSGIAATIGGPLARLAQSGLQKGADPMSQFEGKNITVNQPTYVPTKMNISLILLPVISRLNNSKLFSLKGFANGSLLKKGFW